VGVVVLSVRVGGVELADLGCMDRELFSGVLAYCGQCGLEAVRGQGCQGCVGGGEFVEPVGQSAQVDGDRRQFGSGAEVGVGRSTGRVVDWWIGWPAGFVPVGALAWVVIDVGH
jgi:hypothetical protein